MGSWPSIRSKATASPPIRQPLPQRHLDGDRAELSPQEVDRSTDGQVDRHGQSVDLMPNASNDLSSFVPGDLSLWGYKRYPSLV